MIIAGHTGQAVKGHGKEKLMTHRFAIWIGIGLMLALQFGCIGLKTYPYYAQAGDTVTIGGGLDLGLANEFMDRGNTKVTLTKDEDPAFGTREISRNVRSLFQLDPDPRSELWNYNMFLGPLSEGRPFQTGLALDLPTDLKPGVYTVHVSSTVTFNDWNPKVQIIDDPNVLGVANCFQDKSGFCNNVTALERQRYVRVAFDVFPDEFNQKKKLGALVVVLTVDPAKVPIKDINVVSPRINYGSSGFGTTNRDHLRMFYWEPRNLDTQLWVQYACPRGVESKDLFFDVVYPRGKINPITLTSAVIKAYDIDGADMTHRMSYTMEPH